MRFLTHIKILPVTLLLAAAAGGCSPADHNEPDPAALEDLPPDEGADDVPAETETDSTGQPADITGPDGDVAEDPASDVPAGSDGQADSVASPDETLADGASDAQADSAPDAADGTAGSDSLDPADVPPGECDTDEDCVALPCPDPCMIPVCLHDSGSGLCGLVPAGNGAACDDGDLCTELDSCVSGVCGGTPKDCHDDLLCKQTGCDPGTGQCVVTAVTGCFVDGLCFDEGLHAGDTGSCSECSLVGNAFSWSTVPCLAFYPDQDMDGFGDAAASSCQCQPDATWTTLVPGDCDDDDPAVYPGSASSCGLDADCDGLLLDAWEACDDGNDVAWDGCNACQIAEWQVNQFTAGEQRVTSAVTWPDGAFALVWASGGQDGSGSGVYARRYAADGTAETDEVRLNLETEGSQKEGAACARPDGSLVVAFTGPAACGSFDVMLALFDSQMQRLAGDIPLHGSCDGEHTQPATVCFPDGSFVVVWTSDGSSDEATDVRYQRFSANLQPASDWIRLNSYHDDVQFDPGVAPLPGNGFVAVWTSYGQDGDKEGVFGQVVDGTDAFVGAEFMANAIADNFQADQRVAGFPDGTFVVTWQRENDAILKGEVRARVFSGEAVPLTEDLLVNTYNVDCQDHPVPAVLSDDTLVTAYRTVGYDGDLWGVGFQRLDHDLEMVGPETIANTYTKADQWYPRVAAFAGSGFLLTWTSVGQDGSGSGVFAQRFAADMTRLYK